VQLEPASPNVARNTPQRDSSWVDDRLSPGWLFRHRDPRDDDPSTVV
jgi:hypothetical protein